jgi:hypothetical protein
MHSIIPPIAMVLATAVFAAPVVQHTSFADYSTGFMNGFTKSNYTVVDWRPGHLHLGYNSRYSLGQQCSHQQ